MIRTDGSNDLLNYGAIPDSPYDSSNEDRIMELSDVSYYTQTMENSTHRYLVNVIRAGKSVSEMGKELGMELDMLEEN